MIRYQIENNLAVEEFQDLLIRSTLGERRPVNDSNRMVKMVKHANLIITARNERKLIGLVRSLTDFSYCTYLSDLAVDRHFLKKGIGKMLIKRTQEKAPFATLILLSAPKATQYYPNIGMQKHEGCFILDYKTTLKE